MFNCFNNKNQPKAPPIQQDKIKTTSLTDYIIDNPQIILKNKLKEKVISNDHSKSDKI